MKETKSAGMILKQMYKRSFIVESGILNATYSVLVGLLSEHSTENSRSQVKLSEIWYPSFLWLLPFM